MENDLIRRSDALTELEKVCNVCVALVARPMCDECSVADTVRTVKHIPAVDAEPVVRCKDCKYYEIYELKSDGTDDRRYRPSVCVKDEYAEHRKPDWFCADGEVKE